MQTNILQMVEVMEGSGVLNSGTLINGLTAQPLSLGLDISMLLSIYSFLKKPLTPIIIDALIGKVCSKFSKESPLPSQIIQKINMKCVEARRPQRVREQRLE
ncbi:uncharacterized protein [Acropora muricata]|uniref:uncharacterized protein n=1 Tax=Acropora muricata TaxID=159855 RepID=UPI0034E50952